MTKPRRGLKPVTRLHPPEMKKRALKKYQVAGTVAAACAAVRVGRRTWYDWIEQDPRFAAAVLEAHEIVADDLEAEALRRAKAGSDSLLMLLLRARRPERYRESQRIELVSPAVRENLRRTIEIIQELLTPDEASSLLAQLDVIWQS